MQLTTNDLVISWQDLRRRPLEENTNGWRSRYPVPSNNQILLAVNQEGNPALLLREIGKVNTSSFRCPELDVQLIKLNDASGSNTYLTIVCQNIELEIVFALVSVRMLDQVCKGQSALTALEETLKEFRRLLRSQSEISAEKAIGLIGELLVLEKLLNISSSAWRGWVGPNSDPRDFRFGSCEVECKSSRNSQDPKVEVHGYLQLDPAEGQTLSLAHIILDSDVNGQITVPSLVSNLLPIVSDAQGFLDQLEKVSYIHDHPKPWLNHTYTLISLGIYIVKDGFPRLTANSIPNGLPLGITSLNYSIRMSYAAPYRIDVNDWLQAIKEEINNET